MDRPVENLVLGLFYMILMFSLLPIFFLILLSFSGGWPWPEIFPSDLDPRAWKYVLGISSGTWTSVWISLKVAFFTVVIDLILAIPAGNALGRSGFPLKGLIETILMLPVLVPPIVVLMGLHRTFIRLGITETFTGVVLAHVIPTLPYMIRAVTIGFEKLGFQWEEQARVLGAGWFRRLQHITLPFLLPGIMAGSALTILISMSQYVITLLIGGGQVITLTMRMFPYVNGGDQSTGATYAVLFSLVALLLLILMDLSLNRLYREKRL